MQANKLRRVVSSAIAVSVFLVVAAIALFGTFFIAALWHACPPYERIQHGMTKQEVRYILGHSAHREPIGGQGDWMVPRKLPAEEGEEKELLSLIHI